jgi:hypothetical protein
LHLAQSYCSACSPTDGLLVGQRFFATTVLTSVTGFFFHSASFGPPHVIAVISLAILAAAIVALYVFRLVGFWRWIYVSGAVAALYLNVFVVVVQAFQKLPLLQPLAPTQSEPPFVVAQVIVLVIFVALGIGAVKSFFPNSDPFGISRPQRLKESR